MKNEYAGKYVVLSVTDDDELFNADFDGSVFTEDVLKECWDDILADDTAVFADPDDTKMIIVAKICKVYKKVESPFSCEETICEC